METYKALQKALIALKAFRKQSELETNELQSTIVKHTDWEGVNNLVNDFESTLLAVNKLI